MASFGDQLQAAQVAHRAASAVEAATRQQIGDAFESWAKGDLDAQTIRHKLEAIIRAAYRSSAQIAATAVTQQADIPGWRAIPSFSTDYLQSLLADVRKNLREYKASPREDIDLRRAVSRMEHSAGVGAQRGYTDSQIDANVELADFGYQLKKFWLANWDGNLPCPECQALHGTEVGLKEKFPGSDSTSVYKNLIGPPRHPRCQCYLVVLMVALENAFEKLDIDHPQQHAPQEMSSDDVKKVSSVIFDSIIAVLKKIISFVKGR